MDVSADCGSEMDPMSVLALASPAAGTPPNATRELYKCSKCQNMVFFFPGMYLNVLNASLLALFLAWRMLSLSPASLVVPAECHSPAPQAAAL